MHGSVKLAIVIFKDEENIPGSRWKEHEYKLEIVSSFRIDLGLMRICVFLNFRMTRILMFDRVKVPRRKFALLAFE